MISRLAIAASDHDSAVVRVDLPQPVGIRHAHLCHRPVTVQVVGRILVQQAVQILVVWARRAAERVRRRKRYIGAVGVEFRTDVERPRIDQTRDARVAPIVAQQIPRPVKRHFSTRQFAGVNVAVIVIAGFVEGVASLLVRDLQHHQRRPFQGLADRVEVREPGVRTRPTFQQRVGVGGGVIFPPVRRRRILGLSHRAFNCQHGDACRESDEDDRSSFHGEPGNV